MANAFAMKFYQSKAWKQCRRSYNNSRFNLCERCNRPGKITHHKVLLTPENISNACITLAWENLELLCLDCHNAEHMVNDTDPGMWFDANGYLIDRADPPRG